LILKHPEEQTITESSAIVEKDKAQSMLFAGTKRPEQGWSSGLYTATYTVERGGDIVPTTNFLVMMPN